MCNSVFSSLLLSVLVSAGMQGLYSQSPRPDMTFDDFLSAGKPVQASPQGSVLTFTQIRTPWYAPRFFVAKKLREGASPYKKVQGLLQKDFYVSADNRYFGGIYIWGRREDADSLFNQKWYDRVLATYKHEGNVVNYALDSLVEGTSVGDAEGKFWLLLSRNTALFQVPLESEGFIRRYGLRSLADGSDAVVTLWQSKATALSYITRHQIARSEWVALLCPITIRNSNP